MRCKDFRIFCIGYLAYHYLLHFDTEIRYQIIDAGGELSIPIRSSRPPLENNNHDSSRFSIISCISFDSLIVNTMMCREKINGFLSIEFGKNYNF